MTGHDSPRRRECDSLGRGGRMNEDTILWFDFETFGSLPRPWDRGRSGPYRRRDRPAQFGAIRTTTGLEVVGDPVEFRCAPPIDEPPAVGACLVTGITPQDTEQEGLPEWIFWERVLEEMSVPGSICTGWNSLGYDDEVVRFGAWRNLLPTYDREWRNGNRRFDLLAAFRLAWSTGRRDGIEWPLRDDGSVSLRLEDLAAANGIQEHAASAHDALGDVRATIELGRILRRTQPRLFSHALEMGRKRRVAELVDEPGRPFVLSGPGFGAARGHATVAIVVLNAGGNERVVVDLHEDPARLLELSPRQLHARFHGLERDPDDPLPVRRFRINSVPMVAPPNVLGDSEAWERLRIDREEFDRRETFVREHRADIVERLRLVLDERPEDDGEIDVEERLYGGFVQDHEAAGLRRARDGGPEALRRFLRGTEDERLSELAFRMLARRHPDALDAEESARWTEHLRDRLVGPGGGESPRVIESLGEIEEARRTGRDDRVLRDVEAWTRRLAEAAGVAIPAAT